MKKSVGILSIGALALLCSSVGVAATVTVVPSTTSPSVGQQFTVTIHADDMVNVGGATMSMTWNTSAYSYIGGSLPASGPVTTGTASFLIVHLPTFDVLPGPLSVSGAFDVAVFTFQAGYGFNVPMNLVVSDDGGITTGWFDATTAEPIPVTYVQRHICASTAEPDACPAPIVPIPAAAWLFASALGVMGWMRRKVA